MGALVGVRLDVLSAFHKIFWKKVCPRVIIRGGLNEEVERDCNENKPGISKVNVIDDSKVNIIDEVNSIKKAIA